MVKARVSTDPTRTVRSGLELKVGLAGEISNETYLGLSRSDLEATPDRRYAASALDRMAWRREQLQLVWPLEVGDVQIRTVAYRNTLDRAWRKLNRFADGPDVHSLLQAHGGGASEVYLAVLRGEADTTLPGERLQIGTNDRQFEAMGVQTRMRWQETWGDVSSRLEVGARVHSDRVVRLHTEDPYDMIEGTPVRTVDEPELVLVDTTARALAVAAYLHEDLVIGRVHVVPGLRVESIRATYRGQQWSGASLVDTDPGVMRTDVVLPGLGLSGEVADNVVVFAGVHRGFSPASPSAAGVTLPETSWNLEGGLRVGDLHRRLEVVGFFNDYQNLTAQCTTSSGCLDDLAAQQFDAGRVWVMGVEAMLGYELLLPRNLSLPVEVTYTRTESRFRRSFTSPFPQWGHVSTGDALPYVPRDQGAARISLVHERARIGAAVVHRGAMLDQAATFPVDDTDVPALTTLDLQADVAITKSLTAYAVGTNVTDVRRVVSWRPLGARPLAPAQIMVGLKVLME